MRRNNRIFQMENKNITIGGKECITKKQSNLKTEDDV